MNLCKLLLPLLLAMAVPVVPYTCAPVAQAQNIIVEKHMRQGRQLMDQKRYEAAIRQFDLALKDSPNHSEALRLKRECQQHLENSAEERRQEAERKEREAYEAACQEGSVERLQAFVMRYPNSHYSVEAQNKIQDMEAWQKACLADTKEAYSAYIRTTSTGAFNDEANRRIREFVKIETDQQMRERWSQIRESDDVEQFSAFLRDFPDSEFADEASYRVNLFTAEECYATGGYNSAVGYYEKANRYRTLSGDHLAHYKEIQKIEKHESMMRSSDKTEVWSYFNSLDTSSPFYDQASDHYAELMVAGFTTATDESQYKVALRYAKSDAVRNKINSRMEELKRQEKINKRYERSSRRSMRAYNRRENARSFGRGIVNVLKWTGITLGYITLAALVIVGAAYAATLEESSYY